MTDLRLHIKANLEKVLEKLALGGMNPKISHPTSLVHGDYTTNISLQAFGTHKIALQEQGIHSPLKLGEKIQEIYGALGDALIEKVEVVAPGFVNFWVSEAALGKQLDKVLSAKQIEIPTKVKNGQKIMVEYTDPNPFKEFHIGHLYSNTVGESLARLFEAEGAEVKRANYQGDVGMHVAKAVWGMLAQFKIQNANFKSIEDLKRETLEVRIKFLGEAYAKGASLYEEDPQAKEEIKQLNKQIFEKDPSISPLYEVGRAWSLEYFETIYARLGTAFDEYYFESEVGPKGSEIVRTYQEKGVFEESDGAIIFPGEKYGLHNRVFINSLGLPTYEAKELGLNKRKFEEYPFDLSVIVTGNEINEYFKVLFAAMKQIIPEVAERTKHVGHGMVRLPEGKMSSRTGNVVTGEWLLDEAKRQIKEKFPEMDEVTAEIVAVGAIKYSLLRVAVGGDISFSFEESISLEGNSGPYLQYTFVRTQSILMKSGISNFQLQISNESHNTAMQQFNNEESLLLRKLSQSTDVISDAANQLAPHVIATYLFELAQTFNSFYQKCPILESDNKETRLALTAATGKIIEQGLYLLGIKVPEGM